MQRWAPLALVLMVLAFVALADAQKVTNKPADPNLPCNCTIWQCPRKSGFSCPPGPWCEHKTCKPVKAPDGSLCEPTDKCAVGYGYCAAGICKTKTTVECQKYPDECKAYECDSATGKCTKVVYQPDGYACRGGTCKAGKCVPDGKMCYPSTPCKTSRWNPRLKKCIEKNVRDGKSCDDGNPDTCHDKCTSGSCYGTSCPYCKEDDDCTKSGDQCNEGKCVAGKCKSVPKRGYVECDDGNINTCGDRCRKGKCVGGRKCPGCDSDDDCDKYGNQCNFGKCVRKQCRSVPKPDQTECDDHNVNTCDDYCVMGVCEAGEKCKSCEDENDCYAYINDCNDGLCVDGKCKSVPREGECSDYNANTCGDTCKDGQCVKGGICPNCQDHTDCTEFANQCNDGKCIDSKCQSVPIQDGSVCNDGNSNTCQDTCQDGVCTKGGVCATCQEDGDCIAFGNQCNVGVCDPDKKVCVSTPKPNDVNCTDFNVNTCGDKCTDGTCIPGGTCPTCETDPDCTSFGDQCNDGRCHDFGDGSKKCISKPLDNGTVCDDHNVNTCGDTCVLGECVGGGLCSTCTDDWQCSSFSNNCNEGKCIGSKCKSVPKNDGVFCGDGNANTCGDTCQEGTCVSGGPCRVCQEDGECIAFGNQCNVGVCDPDKKVCVSQPKPDDVSCSDHNINTCGDKCTNGTCVPGGGCPTCETDPDCENFGDQCNEGRCHDFGNGNRKCISKPKDNGTVCNDHNVNTCRDTCVLGECVGGGLCPECNADPDCSAFGDNKCNEGKCVNSKCKSLPKENGVSCEDGSPLSCNDTCVDGKCKAGPPCVPECTSDDNCTDLTDSAKCLVGVCSEGKCAQQSGSVGDQCDDGDESTCNDRCINVGGVLTCQGKSSDCGGQCTVDANFNSVSGCASTSVCCCEGFCVTPVVGVDCSTTCGNFICSKKLPDAACACIKSCKGECNSRGGNPCSKFKAGVCCCNAKGFDTSLDYVAACENCKEPCSGNDRSCTGNFQSQIASICDAPISSLIPTP